MSPSAARDPGPETKEMRKDDDELLVLSLPDLVGFLARHALFIAAFVVIGVVLSAGAYLLAQREYRADVFVVPYPDATTKGLDLGGSGLGQLTSILGVGGSNAWRQEAVALLNSNHLATSFVQSRGLVKELVIDSDPPIEDSVRLARAVKKFKRQVLHVDDDRATGIVRVSLTWPDRKMAASLANEFVRHANDTARIRVIRETEESVSLLNQELAKTESIPVKAALSQLVGRESQRHALAQAKSDLAFRIVDAAQVALPEGFVKPNIVSYGLGGLAGGVLAGVLFSVYRHRRQTRPSVRAR